MTDHNIPIRALSLITDGVMGGRSSGTLTHETVQGREAVRMRGTVSLENDGGFIQMAADLNTDGSPLDASNFNGIEVTATGNGETYNFHLRTSNITRPWQSYRQSFIAGSTWETHRIPFTDFAPHRIEAPLDITTLQRIGILGIGRVFEADISISELRFY
ncbi:MAG: CIA30 family protein [Devosiaceae bacterium]